MQTQHKLHFEVTPRALIYLITHEDLTETTNDTNQAITLFNADAVVAGLNIQRVTMQLLTAFEDQSDTAFNDVTVEVGDTDTDRFLAAQQINVNGTEILFAQKDNAYMYTATVAGGIKATFNPMSGKALADLDAGELAIEIQYRRFDLQTVFPPVNANYR
jgi:hypothetical protein